MKTLLYQLNFCDNGLSYENHKEEFCIGIFSSFDKAKEIAEYYLNNINGFEDYDCSYNIVEKKILGKKNCNEVYIIYGWNENLYRDEIEIIESECFMEKDAAEQNMIKLQQIYNRANWCIDRYVIDRCLWKDGFARV